MSRADRIFRYGLLAICVVRFWLMPLASSFWVDEMGTMFVIHHGAVHPSFRVAPQVPASLYYWLPGAMDHLLRLSGGMAHRFGATEAAYRLPSVIAMGIALFVIARITARLIGEGAAWFVTFTCFGLRGISYEADDARPYALGTLAGVTAMLFLIRWLDNGRRTDALWFLVSAAILLRVHLMYWPFYLVFAVYVAFRLFQQDTRVNWRAVALVSTLLALLLVPVVLDAIPLLRQAHAHVFVPPPTFHDLRYSLRFGLIIVCALGALLFSFLRRRRIQVARIDRASVAAVIAWWLFPPLFLFVFSRVTGNSVFVARYYSLGLPGIILLAAMAASLFLGSEDWKFATWFMAIGALLIVGHWREHWPAHHPSDWRGAASAINQLGLAPTTPVMCTSPFVEARPPAWSPQYPLPGFLYAQLETYPVNGTVYTLPFERLTEADQFADSLARQTLPRAQQFVLYGSLWSLRPWLRWVKGRAEFAGWSEKSLGDFGDVGAYLVQSPPAARHQYN